MQYHNHNTNGEVLNGLIIEDNGIGMSPLALHRMLSFGHCDKVIIFKFLCTIILIFSNLETNRWFDSYWPLWKWFQIWYDWTLFKKWLTIQLWRVNANRKGCSCVYKRQRNAKCWISITSMNFNHSYKEITFSLLFFRLFCKTHRHKRYWSQLSVGKERTKIPSQQSSSKKTWSSFLLIWKHGKAMLR